LIAKRLGYLENSKYVELCGSLDEIGRMLACICQYLQRKIHLIWRCLCRQTGLVEKSIILKSPFRIQLRWRLGQASGDNQMS